MILIVCENCSLCMRVMGPAEEIVYLVGEKSEYWPDKYPCPTCEKMCKGVPELLSDPRALSVMNLVEVNPQEAFAALNGLGLPKETNCTAEVVGALLLEQPIRRIKAANVWGANRCIIDHFELWDGTRVYLGAGGEGAVVYRIVRPQSYVEKADGR